MENWLQTFFGWLPDGRGYYLLLAVISFFESVVGIGLLVPGSVLIVFAGFLVFQGKGTFPAVFAASATGAFAGDLLSFWLGARLGSFLLQKKFFRRQQDVLRRAEIFFSDHGGKSVFFGRFLGPLRGSLPFIAGCARMQPAAFLAFTLLSSLLWGLAYPGLGFVGGASWRQAQVWTGRLGLLVALLLVLFFLNSLFWKKMAPHLTSWISRRWERLRSALEAFRQHPATCALVARHPRFWRFFGARFSLQRGTGLYLTVGFISSILFVAAFFWLVGNIPLLGRLDREVYAMMATFQHPAADTLMLTIALLGEKPILLVFAAYLLLWLLLYNRDFSALILAVGLGSGELLSLLLRLRFLRLPPGPFISDLPAALAGGGGSSLTSYLFCGLAVYFILGTFGQWQTRLTLVIAGSFTALLTGFSRIYLGVQWLSSVLAGMALAALWLTFLLTAAEIRRRYAGEFPWRTGWEPLHLARRTRGLLLAIAAAAVFGAVAFLLLGQVSPA